MGRWKIKRDVRKEETELGEDASRAANFASKEKKWSQNMGMLGAIALPLAVAATVFTGPASMPLWAGVMAAGVGSLAAAKIGEEMAEASDAGHLVWGEDTYSRGDSIRKGKFLKEERKEVRSSMIDLANDLDSGMMKDAAVSAALYGIKVGGKDLMSGGKDYAKGLMTGDQLLKEEGKKVLSEKVFGTVEQQAINADVIAGKKDKFANFMKSSSERTRPDSALGIKAGGKGASDAALNRRKHKVSRGYEAWKEAKGKNKLDILEMESNIEETKKLLGDSSAFKSAVEPGIDINYPDKREAKYMAEQLKLTKPVALENAEQAVESRSFIGKGENMGDGSGISLDGAESLESNRFNSIPIDPNNAVPEGYALGAESNFDTLFSAIDNDLLDTMGKGLTQKGVKKIVSKITDNPYLQSLA